MVDLLRSKKEKAPLWFVVSCSIGSFVLVLMIAALISALMDDGRRYRESEARKWQENGRRIKRCEEMGGIPILNTDLWLIRCDFPPGKETEK